MGTQDRSEEKGETQIPHPSIILANVQSLRNKVDELQAKVKFLSEYRSACFLALTETWLKDQDPLSDFELDCFGEPVCLDRDSTVMGKSLGGGLCLYINKKYVQYGDCQRKTVYS